MGSTTIATQNIVNGLLTINCEEWQAFKISVPQDAKNIHVQGSFLASGGSGNDIMVAIMTEENFLNFQNGHTVNVFYNSGQLTVNNFDVALPFEGNYYIVYSNLFSSFSAKRVQTTVNLIYDC